MRIQYEPIGTCSTLIDIDVDDGIINKVEYTGGCPGNLLAISKLLKGAKVKETIELLEGTRCGDNPTSCTDQLAQALKTMI